MANMTTSAAVTADDLEFLPPSSARRPRVTPRNSDANDSLAAAASETPYETLRQLANIPPRPQTPIRRASSAGPSSTHRSNRRTPAARTPGASYKPGSVRRPAAATPHAQAARRGLEERRTAALTPGRRRQSIRQQKDTPRDALRLLSNILAPGTTVIPSSSPAGPDLPQGKVAVRDVDDSIDDFGVRPRLSLPITGEDDEDDLIPPQMTPIPDDITRGSVEHSRRANSEQHRAYRESLGSMRMSDAYDIGLNNSRIDNIDSSFIQPGFDEDNDDRMHTDDPTEPQDFTTGVLQRTFFDRDPFGRLSEIERRSSGIGSVISSGDRLDGGFALPIPLRDLSEVMNFEEAQEVEEEEPEETGGLEGAEYGKRFGEAEEEPEDVSMIHQTVDTEKMNEDRKVKKRKQKSIKVSKHGMQYPSLPVGVVKKLATTFTRTSGNGKAKLNKETIEAILQASDWFLEQVSEDLGTYSKHAGRKTIDESDVITLFRRQRQTNVSTTPFALAHKYLPRELLQNLRMAPPSKLRKG